jgi:Fic family protein
MYIHQNPDWPKFTWDNRLLLNSVSNVRNLQGKLLGKMAALGFSFKEEAMLEVLTTDVVKSTLIEGENLDVQQVRSSIARKLGIEISGLVPSDRNVEGVVEMMLDATQKFDKPLTKDRLFDWHAALFPTGRSGMYKITVADWRKDETGPMQVVSGPMGKEKVHFEAPPAHLLEDEMKNFLQWFNEEITLEPVIKAGIAHLWFITIHPFDDGNGRIARAIADMQLARADKTNQRFYSMSTQIEKEKKLYYETLERTQKGLMEITNWLKWFMDCLMKALEVSEESLAKVLTKAKFWEKHATTILSQRQQTIINHLLDDFYGKLTTSKWAKMAKCSQDTALRDIQDLIDKKVLMKESGGGRSTSYVIISDFQEIQ